MAVLLFAILFGIIDFGMIFNQQNSLSNATRQGAREGVVGSVTCNQIIGDVQQAMKNTLDVTSSSVTVLVTRSDGVDPCGEPSVCDGSSVGNGLNANLIVTASYASKPLVPLMYIATPTFTLSTKATYECEYSS